MTGQLTLSEVYNVLTDDQQVIAGALARAILALRHPTPTPAVRDPYADLADSYLEDVATDAPRPGDNLTPKTPTSPDSDANALSDSTRERADENFHGFHIDGDVRYE